MLPRKLLPAWDTGGWGMKMSLLSLAAVLVIFSGTPGTDSAASPQSVKYMYYLGDDRIANWSVAVAKCQEGGGELTGDIDIDDWELLYGQSSVFLDDNYFWIGLRRDVNMNWKWLGGAGLDLNLTASFPLRPEFAANITWDCVQWNVKEPFYVPQACDVPSPFICRHSGTSCTFKDLGQRMLNETGIQTLANKNDITAASPAPMYLQYQSLPGGREDCKTKCKDFTHATAPDLECWMFEFHTLSSGSRCKLVISDGKPVLINLQSSGPEVTLFSKYCVEVEKFTNCEQGEECICGNVTSNPTSDQLKEILEETKEKLTVPKTNLSATVRKKKSAADDRPTSKTMGYFGCTLITVTFVGLIVLDFSSLIRDFKIMMYNLKCGGGSPPPAPPHPPRVNLQSGGPKQSYA